jgi:hypothetical protein
VAPLTDVYNSEFNRILNLNFAIVDTREAGYSSERAGFRKDTTFSRRPNETNKKDKLIVLQNKRNLASYMKERKKEEKRGEEEEEK